MFQPARAHASTFTASAVLAALLILPWWRNHTLLLDFFDYGLVMAAVGRMQLGESPYVDFISPIQTLQFFASSLGERVWGERYLSLTYTNAVFILGSFATLAALLWRSLGAALALVLAAGVVVSSAGQHTIVWYNAMGVVWLAVVVWLTARTHAGERSKLWPLALIWAALWLGGMTKLTFQAASLAFAITFTLRSASVQAIAWSTASWRIASFVGFGVVAPIATELVVTGATFEQWLNNVVVLPARFRTDMLGQITTLQFYLRTPHDYYHFLPFKFIGAWGVGLLLLTLGGIVRRMRAQSPQVRVIDWLMLAALGGGAWICSAVLLATNMDIAYVSAAVPLVLATGIALAYSSDDELARGRSWMRGTLGAAAFSLLIPAWFAAWVGTRALWGHERLDRAALVSADNLPGRFNYLRGMRILPTLHADLRTLDQTLDQLVADGLPPTEWHFTHAMEWLVRAVPEARRAGFPLWFARGTTYSDDDTWAMADALENTAGVRAIFSYEGWNYWSAGLKALLKERYTHRVAGHRIHVYQHRKPPEPIAFAVNTHSNLYLGQLSVAGGPVELDVLSNGLFHFGGRDPHRIDIGFGLYRLEGELVGELAQPNPEQAVAGRFQIFAREGDRLTDQLWDETIDLSAAKQPVLRPFSISPGGRAVTLMLDVLPDSPAKLGWRKLRTDHVGPGKPEFPWPLNRQLNRQPTDDAMRTLVFGARAGSVSELIAYGSVFKAESRDGDVQLFTSAPSELWIELIPPAIHVAGEFRVLESAWSDPALERGLRVSVIAYKAGRFDVRYQRELHPRDKIEDRKPQLFETWLPENSGWIGIVVTTMDGKAIDGEVLSWLPLRVW